MWVFTLAVPVATVCEVKVRACMHVFCLLHNRVLTAALSDACRPCNTGIALLCAGE